MSQRVVDQAVAEGNNAVREVVLREPGHNALLLHVGTAGHVHDQVAQILPVPVRERHPVSAAAWHQPQPPHCDSYLTTSTAPARTFGSLPIMDTLAANEPSILNTTNSVLRGTIVR